MKSAWACGAASVAAIALAGCGGSSPYGGKSSAPGYSTPSPQAATSPAGTGESDQTSAAARLPGYLARAQNGALFIQWQRQGSSVTGKLSESYFDQSDPTHLKAEADSFSGTITGSQVSINLDTGDTWSGTLSGSTLTLSYTATDGSLQSFDFHPATAADYNQAVAQTKAQVGGAVTAQQQAQATQKAEQQLDTDANAFERLRGPPAGDLSGRRRRLHVRSRPGKG